MHLALLVSVRAFFRPRWHTLYAKRDAEPVGNGEDDTDPSAKRTRLNGAEKLNGEVYGEHIESVIPAHRSPCAVSCFTAGMGISLLLQSGQPSMIDSSLGGPSMNMYSLDGVGLGAWEWV